MIAKQYNVSKFNCKRTGKRRVCNKPPSLFNFRSQALVSKRRDAPRPKLEAFLLPEDHEVVQADISKWAAMDPHKVELIMK